MAIMKTGASDQDATTEARRGRGRPQARPDDETRAVILESARHEFASSGYAATNMESVARRAGVSTRTLYRLIPNKAAVFEAMLTERISVGTFMNVMSAEGIPRNLDPRWSFRVIPPVVQ